MLRPRQATSEPDPNPIFPPAAHRGTGLSSGEQTADRAVSPPAARRWRQAQLPALLLAPAATKGNSVPPRYWLPVTRGHPCWKITGTFSTNQMRLGLPAFVLFHTFLKFVHLLVKLDIHLFKIFIYFFLTAGQTLLTSVYVWNAVLWAGDAVASGGSPELPHPAGPGPHARWPAAPLPLPDPGDLRSAVTGTQLGRTEPRHTLVSLTVTPSGSTPTVPYYRTSFLKAARCSLSLCTVLSLSVCDGRAGRLHILAAVDTGVRAPL